MTKSAGAASAAKGKGKGKAPVKKASHVKKGGAAVLKAAQRTLPEELVGKKLWVSGAECYSRGMPGFNQNYEVVIVEGTNKHQFAKTTKPADNTAESIAKQPFSWAVRFEWCTGADGQEWWMSWEKFRTYREAWITSHKEEYDQEVAREAALEVQERAAAAAAETAAAAEDQPRSSWRSPRRRPN